ncbi:hypothetical protein ABK040_009554 [Willaertia magna]
MFFKRQVSSSSKKDLNKQQPPNSSSSSNNNNNTSLDNNNNSSNNRQQHAVHKSHKPVANLESSWKFLKEGVNKLIEYLDSNLKKPFNNAEYSNLYTMVYNLCTQKVDTGELQNYGPTEILYDRYKKVVSEYLKDRVVPSLKEKQGEILLVESVKRWRDHLIVVKYLTKLFSYLDRFYTKHNNRDSLKDVGLKAYQQKVYEIVKKDMAQALLDKIHKERDGDLIDRSLMKDGINLFIEMGLNSIRAYEEDFEKKLLLESESYYQIISAKWISEDSCPEYLKKAEERLELEEKRSNAYLYPTTKLKLLSKVQDELITKHQDTLIQMENSGLIPLLISGNKDDLARMFKLFDRINNLRPMADKFRDFVKEEGMKILQQYSGKNEVDFKGYIESLLNLHEIYSKLVTNEFKLNSLFLDALRDAFTHFINLDVTYLNNQRSSTDELLSSYCDHIMKDIDKVGEDKLDELLENIVKLFGYLKDKDCFNEYYRRQLSKRLLVSNRSEYDAERLFISKLKMRMGNQFTSKLEGMIKDKTLSEDLVISFNNYLQQKSLNLPIDFTPQILTRGLWPTFKIDQINVTEEFTKCMTTFKEFYDSRTESRNLTWVHSLGTCQVLARFQNGDKDLLTNEFQTCILLLFNNSEELTFNQIQQSIQIPINDLRKNLLTLCASKNVKILLKTGNQNTINNEDIIKVNQEFNSKSRRIKIPNIIIKLDSKEKEDIDRTTQEDRKHAIEAAIVRIMKARKQLDHQQLVAETIKQLSTHFHPDPKIIKKRIEDLITREYLERDSAKSNIYRYLA